MPIWWQSCKQMASLFLFITMWTISGHATVQSCAQSAKASPFTLLVSGTQAPRGESYFNGSDVERAAHAEEMLDAGSKGANKILLSRKGEIPQGQPVLEVGPFLNPLGAEIADSHSWIVWDYDVHAAQKIADTGKAQAFSVDLNALTSPEWVNFWKANKAAVQNDKLGAVIMSSVLNYIDYEVVLKEVINKISDRGLLIITNSNVGDQNMMRGRKAPNGCQILEYLLLNYPDLIEILPETELTDDSFEGSRSGIQLAARIRRNAQRDRGDLYELGLQIYATYTAKPWKVSYALEHAKERTKEVMAPVEFWLSEDPKIVAEQLVGIKQDRFRYGGDPDRNRRAEMLYQEERNQQTIELVKKVRKNDPEYEQLKIHLTHPERERFLPERYILSQALELDPEERSAFLKPKLDELYRQLRHPLPNL